jgi:phosphate uptake regulator
VSGPKKDPVAPAFVADVFTLASSRDLLDGLKNQVFRELLTYMLGDPGTIEPAINLILISRHLERIGDHATNIAEDVIFIVEARGRSTALSAAEPRTYFGL